VDVVGDVTYKDVRHACIMLSVHALGPMRDALSPRGMVGTTTRQSSLASHHDSQQFAARRVTPHHALPHGGAFDWARSDVKGPGLQSCRWSKRTVVTMTPKSCEPNRPGCAGPSALGALMVDGKTADMESLGEAGADRKGTFLIGRRIGTEQ
jgi:hypothetical protein